MSRVSRRGLILGAAGLGVGAAAPAGLRGVDGLEDRRMALWERAGGPHLRGAVIVQRRVYPELDGPTFLGPGPVGPPVTEAALASLAAAGANLISWSGPGPFSEAAPFSVDTKIVEHIEAWLARCESHGLFTVLCLRSGPGRSAFAFHPGEQWYPRALYNDAVWRDPAAQQAWIDMVAWTIERFSHHRALAGVLAMDEPNGADVGAPQIWSAMARSIAQNYSPGSGRAPLLLSPDRWARLEVAEAVRAAAGAGPVLVTHDYAPWRYTHQTRDETVRFNEADADDAPSYALGNAAVLEFGAPKAAPDLSAYLRNRIQAYEAARVNWAVFRWTSGWRDYESIEGARALNEAPEAAGVLPAAFSRNGVRPQTL